MSFISYAQNFEDVMLWRALKHIQNGFYIDVGAAWPDEHSVTNAFYKNSWHGINIEPNPELHTQLNAKRAKDINLQLAISEKPGSATMSFIRGTGLSTLDESIASEHLESGWELEGKQVEITTLENICEVYVPANQEVHFLKVDVEGLEKSVLESNDWTHCRPWVVVVEATLPMSQIENHGDWEPTLLNANYILTYADGLNRFYISKEHEELQLAFKYPPNVFDDFKLISEIQAESRAKQAEAKAEQAEAKAEQAEAKAEQAEAKAEQAEAKARQAEAKTERLHAELHSVYTSHSWHITAPLRWLALQTRLMIQFGFIARAKALIKKISSPIIRHSFVFISSRPRLKYKVVAILKNIGLFQPCKSIYFRLSDRPDLKKPELEQIHSFRPTTINQLSPHALHIYSKIEATITERISKNN